MKPGRVLIHALMLVIALLTPRPSVSQGPQYPRGFVPDDTFPQFTVRPDDAAASSVSLPSRWDWREQGAVTPVKHQHRCGTCNIFAFLGEFESKLLISGSESVIDLSENNVKECNFFGTGCSASIRENEIANLLAKTGTVLESCDPYVAEDQGICVSNCPYQHTLLQWSVISSNVVPDTETLKHYIRDYGPIRSSVFAGDYGDVAWMNTFNNYTGGVLYKEPSAATNHAILIIGWDDALTHPGGTGAWIVKNSWGTLWGSNCGYGTEKGYFYIAYGSANIGWSSSYISEYQDYEGDEELLYYDEGGMTGWCPGFLFGYEPNGTAWALATFDVDDYTELSGVEFWTFDATSDVDVYIYQDFDGSQPTGLRHKSLDNQFAEPGYRRVVLDPPVVVPASTVAVVVKITNVTEIDRIISADYQGSPDGKTYFSPDGSPGSWTQMTDRDAGIRLRTAPAVIDFVYCQLPLIVKAHTPPLRPTATPTGPAPTATPTPRPDSGILYLYDHADAQQIAVAEDWEGSLWSSDGQAELVVDPKGIYGQVAKVYVRGYGHGEEVSWVNGTIAVPANADVVAIPLASALNGDVNETDSEAGVGFAIYDPSTHATINTCASHIFDTRLRVNYIVAFADVSESRGRNVDLTIQLRQPDVCGGAACTHNADLYIGDLAFESLPEICTTEANLSHSRYHYYDDPTPRYNASCSGAVPYYFLDVQEGPFNAYGPGEDNHLVSADVPAAAELLEFKVYYGPKTNGFSINGHTLTSQEVYAAFPYHSAVYVNVGEPTRWMPFNDNPAAVKDYLIAGTNTFVFNVYAENSWDERPFGFWARFKVPVHGG